MKTLSINKKEICKIPEQWNELTADQLWMLCNLTYSARDRQSFLIQMFLLISGLKFTHDNHPVMIDGIPHYYLRHHRTRVCLVSTEDLGFAIKPLGFIFGENKEQPVIESRLYENKFPTLRVARRTLYGPDNALYNIRFAEFIRLESLYEQYITTGRKELLDRIIAVLYREKDPGKDPASPEFSGDVRVAFNDHLIDANVKVIARMSDVHKLAIRLFYEGCRWFIFVGSGIFKNAFRNHGNAASGKANVFQEFMTLTNALANGDVTKMEQIRQTLLYDVLYELESLAQRNTKSQEK